ncbi:sigma factor-like helix-turn-helix DNA-binding protein [Enterococcus rotai]|uniref:sigma factor-like helix-turn-helix DNA-binding protein n=1 Tax=Enterococcus rotai TaxID=118060 RepID=UPI0035C6A6C5
MLDWTNREILIQQYKQDLKTATKQHRMIAKKKYRMKVIVGGIEIDKSMDDRTTEELTEQTKYAEIISSTKYALYWLEHGIERPLDQEAAKKIPKHRRAKYITNMDKVSYDVYLNQYEAPVENVFSETKEEQLDQLREIISMLSNRESDLFYYIHTVGLTYGEVAEEMGIEVGTVKSMSQRIKNKIEAYFKYGHQISLF